MVVRERERVERVARRGVRGLKYISMEKWYNFLNTEVLFVGNILIDIVITGTVRERLWVLSQICVL
jgi:hypothetical protein